LTGESPTPRAQPFYCPYCGEEDFVPSGEHEGEFHCRSCNRRFSVTYLGLGPSPVDAVGGGTWRSDTR
jgi:transcription elongation factor Elf1